jgi:response regulator RpfG family c-di-GMP phosphodiesterase
MNQERYVLCVDDEPLLLEGLARTLRENFAVVTETKPLAALALLESRAHDYVAIISDMRMPVMDGAKFLACAAELAPNSTRVLLTGHAELNAAIAAVNTGRIFRFLCKPCPPNELLSAIEAAAEQHQLRNLEKELMEQTLTGSVRLLSEVLMLVAPRLFTQNQRIQTYVLYLAERLGRRDGWRFELAACLNMIGCAALPEDTFNRALAGEPLDEQEARVFAEHPLTAHRLLKKIPRFDDVAEMLRLQAEPSGGSGGTPVSADVELGANLLRVARRVERLVAQGVSEADAARQLVAGASPQERELLGLLSEYRPPSSGELKQLKVAQLTAQMLLESDVKTKTGVVVVPAGKQLTLLLIERLLRFARAGVLIEPVRVLLPSSAAAAPS